MPSVCFSAGVFSWVSKVYGGTIRAGKAAGESLDIVSAFQAYGEYAYDRITDVRHQCSSSVGVVPYLLFLF